MSPFQRPIAKHLGHIRYRRTLAGADVATAGCDAGQETKFRRKPEQFTEAKTRIEMIPGPGGNLRLRGKRTLGQGGAVRPGGQGISSRVNNDCIHWDEPVDVLTKVEQALAGVFVGF